MARLSVKLHATGKAYRQAGCQRCLTVSTRREPGINSFWFDSDLSSEISFRVPLLAPNATSFFQWSRIGLLRNRVDFSWRTDQLRLGPQRIGHSVFFVRQRLADINDASNAADPGWWLLTCGCFGKVDFSPTALASTNLPVEIGFRSIDGVTYNYRMLPVKSKQQSFTLDSVPQYNFVNVNSGPSVRTLLKMSKLSGVDQAAIKLDSNNVEFHIKPNPTHGNAALGVTITSKNLSDCKGIQYRGSST